MASWVLVDTDTLVIGAGPAGLAVSACLGRRGVPFELVERGDRVGTAWHGHYERLHLHTARDHSSLPEKPFPAHFPLYVPRRQVIEYLDAYAAELGLRPRFGEDVVRVRRSDGAGFEVTTRRGGAYRARRVVVATGYNRAPVAPSWPGQRRFRGPVVHSSGYANGAPYRGRRVLVVGIGNTGGEIAIDLHEHGAEPAISVRSPVVVVPRDFLGMPTQVTAIRLNRLRLPVRVQDWIGRLVSWLAFGDLSGYGLGRPSFGPATVVARGRIPHIDVGTVDLIRRGAIAVVPEIDRFEPDGVHVAFRDGSRRPFDAVVLATGYRPRLEDFLEDAARVTDERGYPRALDAGGVLPGLYFVGFVNPPTGFLRQIALDAPHVADRIARERALGG